VKLEAVERVGRAAVDADGGGVHVDGVSQQMSGQGITAQPVQSVSLEQGWLLGKSIGRIDSRISRASSFRGQKNDGKSAGRSKYSFWC
jgi:hypothetical protein